MEEIEMKRKKIKLLAGVMIIAMTGGVFVGCGNNSASNEGKVTITVSGSTSVGPLMEKIAEKYEEENSDVSIEINQTGSSAGIKDAMDGISDIGLSSRDLKGEEASKVQSTVLAYDGVAVITNTSNLVKELTIEQLKDSNGVLNMKLNAKSTTTESVKNNWYWWLLTGLAIGVVGYFLISKYLKTNPIARFIKSWIK